MHDSSIGLTPLTHGDTFDEWRQSAVANIDRSDKTPDGKLNPAVNTSLAVNFEQMRQVPGFLDLFHCAGFVLQKRILMNLNRGTCVWSTAAHLKLLQDTSVDIWDKLTWTSVNLEKSAERLFRHLGTGFGDANSYVFPKVDALTLSMLGMKYGEDRVIEIIELWNKLDVSKPFCAFVQTVEMWDQIKVYPLEWSIQIIRNHYCPNETMLDTLSL